ncbi:MAG: hypothetical protein AABW67_03850 [Nanoarchaeota archaeon]
MKNKSIICLMVVVLLINSIAFSAEKVIPNADKKSLLDYRENFTKPVSFTFNDFLIFLVILIVGVVPVALSEGLEEKYKKREKTIDSSS